MAENYLITGYWGEPHVTAENDRGINAAIFGAGRFVLPVGEQFRAEYIGNNTVRIHDGKLVDNGAVAGIPAGEYVDLIIREAGQGMKRNDLIIFQYSKDDSSLVESGVFMVLSGDETSGTATDPVLSQQDILTNTATFDQMALWRVPVSGAVISAPVQLFSVLKTVQTLATNAENAQTTANGKAPTSHASSQTTYGVSSETAYGHAKASSTTPKANGTASVGTEKTAFARGDHVHPEQVSAHGITTAGSGAAYTATVQGITALTAGACFIMIPHTDSTTTAPTLNVNGLGAKTIRQQLSTNNAITVPFKEAGVIASGKPVPVMYNGTFWVAEITRPDANNLYGTTPIESGGTGGTTAEKARTNLGITPANIGAIPGVTTYYANGISADDLEVPLALIPVNANSNTSLSRALGNTNFAYVLTLFFSSMDKTANRMQLAFSYNATHTSMAMRRYLDGGWTEWVSVAGTSMALGVEYLTAEMYLNKPVYTMLFNGGAISDGAEIDYPGIAAEAISLVRTSCSIGKITIPQRAAGVWAASEAKSDYFACYHVAPNAITVNCGSKMSGNVYVQIWYTKN